MKCVSSEIYSESERVLGPTLEFAGFSVREPAEWIRLDDLGEDRVLIDADERKGRFATLLSHYPADCKIIEQISGVTEKERGFPVGPYLNQVGVGRREYWWGCKSREILLASLERATSALKDVGLPWLRDVHDPQRFAREVDPVAALYAAFAFERAGDFLKARSLYEEMRRRLVGSLALRLPETELVKKIGKTYVFVTAKLGIEDERAHRFREMTGSMPEVLPLPR